MAKQTTIEFGKNNNQSVTGSNKSAFSDPAFAINKSAPIHNWVPWIAGFSKDFVANVLSKYLNKTSLVLDPFAGVGTTIVESILKGHEAVGYEINPYAAMVTRIKSQCLEINISRFKNHIVRFKDFYTDNLNKIQSPISKPPDGFKTRGIFYSPDVLRKVLIVNDYMRSIENIKINELFKIAFAATMVRYSNYSYEPSLGQRVSSGKDNIIDYPVYEEIQSKLFRIAEDIVWLKNIPAKTIGKAKVFNKSFFDYKHDISDSSIDLIITSPPYLNNYHYNRNTRPQLYWLDFVTAPKDMKNLENENFGKYWQTVRSLKQIALGFELSKSDLSDKLEILRNLYPDKGVYGGFGWANYATTYFNDCNKFAKGIYDTLKTDGVAIVVLGNSILQGIMIPTDIYFAQICELNGLEVIGIDISRKKRVGSSIINSKVRVAKAKNKNVLYESIVQIRKPS